VAVSKSIRFEVFARDSFTCQYCGQRPPDVVLEVDHIHPRSKGGGDEIINLISSCYDCNRGKRAKVITEIAPRPDADLAFLKTQQEIVEVKRFLEAKKIQDVLNAALCDSLRQLWQQCIATEDNPADCVLIPWITRYGAEEVSESIAAAGMALDRGKIKCFGDPFNRLLPYIGGILKTREQRRQAQ
jgi:hypothetical protein